MAEEGLRPIVVKKVNKSGGGHHGGAWKIAYADFVTAMMAFFLLMWLLGSTTKGDLNGISEYFQTPLRVGLLGGDGSGDSSSVVKGGGKDLTKKAGQIKNGSDPPKRENYDLKKARADLEKAEASKLRVLKEKLDRAIETSPTLSQFKDQLLIDITSEGLRIQIIDAQNRPMFALSRAEVQPYMREILQEIGIVLNEVDNRIGLSGHTDSTPYASGDRGYSNWELSADRANASRRELIAGGMNESKVVRVVGLADSVPLPKVDPFDASNRRISIIVLNRRTAEAITRGGVSMDVDNDAAGKN